MSRHKRRSELNSTELQNLTEAAAAFSRELQQCLCVLRPTGPQYRTIGDLHANVLETVEEITGEPPAWRYGW